MNTLHTVEVLIIELAKLLEFSKNLNGKVIEIFYYSLIIIILNYIMHTTKFFQNFFFVPILITI